MRMSTAIGLATGATLVSLLAACSSVGSEEPDPAPTPTPQTAGWTVYDGPAAPDLAVREVPLAAGVGRGLDDVDRVERIGGVAVLWGRDDLDDLMKAVDLASGRVLWQHRIRDVDASPLGDVELDGPWDVVPGSGLLVTTSYLNGCERNPQACGIDPRLEEEGRALHAVDARTGAVRWSVPLLPATPGLNLGDLPYGIDRIETAGSVVLVNLVDDRGQAALVQGYDAVTGRRLWEQAGAWLSAAADDVVLTDAIADPDDRESVGPLQGRDALTGKVRWTNPGLPAGVLTHASGTADDGMGYASTTLFSLADGHEVVRTKAFIRLGSGSGGTYGAGDGPALDEGQCCVDTVATVSSDGVWRRSEHAVGESVEWVDGDYIWRTLDTRGEGLVAVDRTGAARSPELPVTYGAQFARGLILSEEIDDEIRIWTYRPRRAATAGEG